jgi:cob(I)alamin adenosyltransferase
MGKTPITISTKTGDAGQTGLADGRRLAKDEPVFGVIGSLDELNSWLGLVAAKFTNHFPEHQAFLYEVQETLFHVGAEVAGSSKTSLQPQALSKLEAVASQMQRSLAEDWHTKFLLPGGTELGAHIDITRTVCRRLEREVVAFQKIQNVSPLILQYLNRLSDFLYLLRCLVNHAVLYPEQEFDFKKSSSK